MKKITDAVLKGWCWGSCIFIGAWVLLGLLNLTTPKIPQSPTVVTDVCVSSKYNDHYEITLQHAGVYRVDRPTFNLCNDRMLRDPITLTIPRDPIHPNWYVKYFNILAITLLWYLGFTVVMGFMIPMIDIATQKDD